MIIETIPKEKKIKKGTMVIWEGLTNSLEKKINERQRWKRKIYPSEYWVPRKSKERYNAFLDDQCKEIKKNNRIGKTRDLFKKIRNTKETFHAMMDTVDDRML